VVVEMLVILRVHLHQVELTLVVEVVVVLFVLPLEVVVQV
tara:strand:- start:7 stop:126 length:120 start_codon:yes stop_codon:yes gene_type:complete